MNLQRFIDAKQDELSALEKSMPKPLPFPRPDFLEKLMSPPPTGQPLHVVAEFKRASPSAGIINGRLHPADVAQQYAEGGASCMSVLTEERYFSGDIADLKAASPSGLPLLRKDFIFDERQVRQTFATPASALLLIVALTPDASHLRHLRELAESQGIHAVVEIFSEEELHIARASGARIFQVNARNLETFGTDREKALELASLRRPGECWIAASAMSSYAHLKDACGAGYQAALIGTALMSGNSPLQNLRKILHA